MSEVLFSFGKVVVSNISEEREVTVCDCEPFYVCAVDSIDVVILSPVVHQAGCGG